MSDEPRYFRFCSTCKAEIGFEREYFLCSVSTCNRKRTGLFFCSVACWDAHVPEARHRDAWAEPHRAPSREAWKLALEAEAESEDESRDTLVSSQREPVEAPRRRVIVATPPPPSVSAAAPPPVEESEHGLPRDVLVVVSKLKSYIKAKSGMNTSDGVVDVLSDEIRRLCTQAIRHAAEDGRKTVMDRDFSAILKR